MSLGEPLPLSVRPGGCDLQNARMSVLCAFFTAGDNPSILSPLPPPQHCLLSLHSHLQRVSRSLEPSQNAVIFIITIITIIIRHNYCWLQESLCFVYLCI